MSKSNIMNDNDSDTYYCNKCNKRVALISKTMHDIRCKGDTSISSTTTASSPLTTSSSAAATIQSSQIPVATARHHIMTSSLGGGIGTTPIIPAQELKSVKSLSTTTTTPTTTTTTTTDYIACPVCTFHNQYDSITCECCDTDLNRNQFNSTNSSSNSLDNHVDNNDNNNNDINDDDEYWSCPDCTCNNPTDVNTCDMCNHGKRPADVRRPDDIINDRLIRDDDDDDDEFCIRSYPSESSSSSSSGIHPLTASALGAIGGIMLARLQNRPMSTGALQGAAYGAMGGMLLNELNSRMDDDIRHQTHIQNHDHFFTSFQQNNNALFMAFNELLESNDNETVSNERMQAINSLPTHIYNEDNNNNGATSTCNICLEPFKNGDGVKSLPCLHKFHTSCIDTWLSRKSECPLCKFSIS